MSRENLNSRYIGTIGNVEVEAITRIRHYQEEIVRICKVLLTAQLWTYDFEVGPDLSDFEILEVAKRQIERVSQGRSLRPLRLCGGVTMKAAYLTRHEPKPEMVFSLNKRGYTVFYDEEAAVEFASNAEDAWRRACILCSGTPDIVVGIIPLGMLPQFLKIANRFHVPVIRPRMRNLSRKPGEDTWEGTWVQTVRIVIEEVEW